MNWKLRERGMSLDVMYIFPHSHETGVGLGRPIGHVEFEWEYDIDLNAFMTTEVDAIIFSKSRGWL